MNNEGRYEAAKRVASELRSVAGWIHENADELSADLARMPVAGNSVSFAIEISSDGFSTVSTNRKYLVLKKA